MSIIQANGVKKWFGDFQALKGISMEIAEGRYWLFAALQVQGSRLLLDV